MSRPKATIVDIARELGISKSAVANVLSGTGRFSAETSALVHEAADRLGYVSNRAAKSLRTGRLGAYGLHLPAIARELPFYMEFAFGAARGADRAHADLTLFTSELAAARSFQVDGAVVIDAAPDEPLVAALLAADRPIVAVGRYRGRGEDRIAATLEARHAELQREVFERLLARGRRSPALLAVDAVLTTTWAVETRTTFEAWAAERGLDAAVLEVGPELVAEPLDEALTRALEQGADALVCSAQGHAALLRRLAADRGLQLGVDLDVASLAASPAELADPALTVIDLDPAAYGVAAAELLSEVVEAPPSAPVHRWFDGARVRPAA